MLPVLVAVVVVGIACVAYGVLIERRWYRLMRYRLDILPAHAERPITVLHLSDLHIVAGQTRKLRRFLATLPGADVTAVTGDVLGEPGAVEEAVALLHDVRGREASYFVLGSNDYFAPRPLNPVRYFLGGSRRRRTARRGRARDLVAQLEADGWEHLRNVRTTAAIGGLEIELMGLDDPHIDRQDLRVAPRRRPDAFGLGVVHSPDPLPELAALGWDFVVYGHTHGGQVRMPFVGALVTNSYMPRRLVAGLARLGTSYAHVSPGLGTSKYAPFRFLCRPEATVLELRPAPQTRVSPADAPSSRGERAPRTPPR
ncbi:MAG: metallophosphoesterase [Actinomycetota bacterium]